MVDLSRRKLLFGLVGAIAAPTALGVASRVMYPNYFQKAKRKLGILESEQEHLVPNSQSDYVDKPFSKTQLENKRNSLEDKIAELFMCKFEDIQKYTPGSVLLTKEETRDWNLFGKYSSYSAQKTQESISKITQLAKQRKQKIIVVDEGEGGYVMRVGTLPAATDIGDYLFSNKIGKTIKSHVSSSNSLQARQYQVQQLFDSYATELKNRGVDVVLGPLLDVVDPRFEDENLLSVGRRNFISGLTTPHRKTKIVGKMYAKAMKEKGIKMVGKHFLTTGLSAVDPHLRESTTSPVVNRRVWATELFSAFKGNLDAVMITHSSNPSDNNRPYSFSRRAYDLLTKEKYGSDISNSPFLENRVSKDYTGINFKGLVMTDDITMKAFTNYARNEELSPRGKKITQFARSAESKATILAIDQGADSIIYRDNIDLVVEDIARTYKHSDDSIFRENLDRAFKKYNQFTA